MIEDRERLATFRPEILRDSALMGTKSFFVFCLEKIINSLLSDYRKENMELDQMIEIAERREFLDDHLSQDERREIVELFRSQNPGVELSSDLDEAFVSIVLD